MAAFVGIELIGLVSGLTFLSSIQQTASTGKVHTSIIDLNIYLSRAAFDKHSHIVHLFVRGAMHADRCFVVHSILFLPARISD